MKKLTLIGLSAASIFTLSSASQAGITHITESNWVSHPQIKQARAVYTDVNQQIKQNNLIKQSQKIPYCHASAETYRELGVSRTGTPRYYRTKGGDGVSMDTQAYYDHTGTMRFVFVTATANNGTKIQQRIYFDGNGERIWENQKQLRGPGYAFDKKGFQFGSGFTQPKAAFQAPSGCS